MTRTGLSLALFVPGFWTQTETRGRRQAQRFQEQLVRLGVDVDSASFFSWSDHRPAGAMLLSGALGRLAAPAMVASGGAVAVLTAAATAMGAASSYDKALKRIPGAAEQLAEYLVNETGHLRNLYLGATSLGTEVVLRALRILAERGYDVPGGVVLMGGTASRRTDWGGAVLVPRDGVFNVYNPADGALVLNGLIRNPHVIGREPMRELGVENVRTRHGHLEQLDALADILSDLGTARGRISAW